jgi:hypothetical protein
VAKGNPVKAKSSGKSLDPRVEKPLSKEEAREKEKEGHRDWASSK